MRVRRLICSVVLVATVFPIGAGCRLRVFPFDGIEGSGRIVEEPREVSGFQAIEVQHALRARYEPGETPQVVLKGDDNLLPLVQVEVVDGRLVIRLQRGSSISPTQAIEAMVRGPGVSSFAASGASQIFAKCSEANSLSLEASGASRVEATDIETEALRIKAEGASTVTALGRASRFELQLSGASKLEGEGLQTADANVTLSGASSARMAAGTVAGEASGASRLALVGEPAKREVRTSGASSVSVNSR